MALLRSGGQSRKLLTLQKRDGEFMSGVTISMSEEAEECYAVLHDGRQRTFGGSAPQP